jgi:ubiquinone biosynthesis protein COQ9
MSKKAKTAHKAPAQDIRRALLEAALPDIAFDGWQDNVLARACEKTGIDIDDAEKALPGGMADLALYFSAWADEKMLQALKTEKLAAMRVRDRVALGLRRRLEILTPWKQAVSATTSVLGFSVQGLAVPKAVWQTADKIWIAAGDASTDYNHYTKRFLLSGVISATTLCWLSDDSPGHQETWDFLDRRIDNVLTIGRGLGSVGGKLRGFTPWRRKRA